MNDVDYTMNDVGYTMNFRDFRKNDVARGNIGFYPSHTLVSIWGY